MKEKTKMKLERGWLKFKNFVSEYGTPIGLGTVSGMILGGYLGAIENSRQIRKVNKRLNTHEKVINYNAGVLNQHADAGNELAAQTAKMQEEIEELQRRNGLLMENALRETKGG